MKKVLLISLIFLLPFFLLPEVSLASAAFVQGKAGTLAKVSPNAIAFTSNITVGNTIIAEYIHSYLGCPVSVSDTLGNTFTSQGTKPDPGGASNYFFLFTAPITTGGTDTVTATYGCGSNRTSFIEEYSGIQATPYDTESVNNPTSNPATTGSLTTATDNELVVSLFYTGIASTYTAGSGTSRLSTTQSALQDQTQATAGAVNPSINSSAISASFPTFSYAAAFKATAAGPTTVVVPGPQCILSQGSLVLLSGQLILGH